MSSEKNEIFYPLSSTENGTWDREWATDWQRVVEIYRTIEHLEYLFEELDVSDYRRITQKGLIIKLKQYAYTLLKLIAEKYRD